jgi:lysophospholipase L1-like esterase
LSRPVAAKPTPVIHNRRTLPLRYRIAFVFLLLAILGIFQEVLFRLAFPFPEVMNFNRNHYVRVYLSDRRAEEARRDGTRNMILRVASDPDGYEFDHTLNLYGFRGPTFRLAPAPDRPRVVFVGDSFAEGMGAADGDTIPEQFARLIGPGRKIEAINLGVSGAGMAEYTRLVRDGLHFLHPSAIYVVVYANDLPAPAYTDELDQPAAVAIRHGPWVPRLVQIVGRLGQGLVVPRFFHGGPFPYFEPVPSESNPLSLARPPDGVDPSILEAMRRGRANPALLTAVRVFEERLRHDFQTSGDTTPYLARMAALCRESGAKLSVVYIPYSAAINPAYIPAQKRLAADALGGLDSLQDPRYRAQQNHLRQVTRFLGIPFLDLTDTYIRAEETKGRQFWPIDGHCNADGYRHAAEACARHWADGSLPDSP